jgi:hypothetical protein
MLPSLSHSLEMIMHGTCIIARKCLSVILSSHSLEMMINGSRASWQDNENLLLSSQLRMKN